MPRYTKDQLTGFVADRRYWDKKHPEHQAHLDFTVKAFEETYPDPLVPTPEQEEWAAAEEKRLREMAKLHPFWDKRDPGHAQAYAGVTRGFDKINAVLYGTPDPGDAAPASAPVERPMRATRDPLDPVMPTNEMVRRTAQLAQAPAQQPAQAPRAESIGPASTDRDSQRDVGGLQVVQETRDGRRSAFQFEFGTRPPRRGEPLEMPPRVIHHGTDAPWDVEAKWAMYPTQVRPEVIYKLWEFLDNEDENFARFAREERAKGRTVRHWLTGAPTPITDSQLRGEFQQLRDQTKEFLWDYYYQVEPMFPDEKKRVPPEGPTKDKNEFNPDSYPIG